MFLRDPRKTSRLALAGILIAIIAFVDWRVKVNIAFGFLYLFPILLLGTVARRWQIVAAAIPTELVAVSIPIVGLIVIAWITHIIVDGNRRKERIKTFTEFYSRLLDRMTSPKDFSEFLQTSGGQRFLETLSVERGHPIDRVLKAIQAGLVLLLLGLGFIVGGGAADWDNRASLRIIGIILASGGVGFLLSATASFNITKSLGLLRRETTFDPHDFGSGPLA